MGGQWGERTLLGRWCKLLQVTWGGQVFRVADAACDVLDADGVSHHFSPGLVSDGYQDTMPAPGGMQGDVEVPVEFVLPIDVAEYIHVKGWDLGTAEAELSILPAGATLEQRVVLAKGQLSEPEYAELGTPVNASIRLAASEDAGQVPSTTQRMTDQTFTTHVTGTAARKYLECDYPVVFGSPGQYVASGTEVKGSPGLLVRVDVVGNDVRVMIACHRVRASTVHIWDIWQGEADLAVAYDYDAIGQLYAYVQLAGTAMAYNPLGAGAPSSFALEYDLKFWIGWARNGGEAMVDPDDFTSPVRHVGDLVRWLLARATVPVDSFRTRVAGEQLRRFEVDGFIDDRTVPTSLISDHLGALLPMALKTGPDGVYPVVWALDATEADAKDVLTEGRGVERVGSITYDTRVEDVRNAVTLDYCISPETGEAQRSMTLDPEAPYYDTATPPAPVVGIFATDHARVSASRYGRREQRLRASWIGQDETAALALISYVRWHGFLRRVFEVDVHPRYGRHRPGTVLLYTAEDLHLDRQVVQVTDWSWSGAWVRLSLVIIEDPIRDWRIRP